MKKIAVLASGGGTNLQALIDAEKNGVIKSGTIAAVVTNNSKAYALERAKNAGIKTKIITKKEYGKDNIAFNNAICAYLKSEGIDVVVLAGFLPIIAGDMLTEYKDRIINIHPSLIPSFCGDGFYGIRVHEAALEKGVKVTGATAHFVNEITDGGKIIMQKAVEVEEDDTPQTLQRRVMERAEWIILPLAAEKVCYDLERSSL